MSDLSATDYLDALLSRIEVVRHLADGVTDKRAITEAVDSSRPTVDRAIQELAEVGIVERGHDGYSLTPFGALLYAEYEELAGKVETLGAAQDLLASLVSDEQFDAEVIADAEVTHPQEYAPHEPITRLQDHVEPGADVRISSPVVTPGHVELFDALLDREEVTGELLLDERATSYLRSTYRDRFEALVRVDRFDVRTLTRRPPFGLFLKNDRLVCVLVTGDDGTLQGTVTTDTRAAVEWAHGVLDELCGPCPKVS